MKKTSFFKPTPLHKEFLILSMVKKDPNITQREIAAKLDISVAMVNFYLDEYEENNIIKRIYVSTKTVKYVVTEEGEARRKLLNIQYLESALDVYNDAKEDCYKFFNQIIFKGFKNILFYGAGEVAEIMLTVINNANDLDLNVLAIVDDDDNKIGKALNNQQIISINDLYKYKYDGILISAYSNNEKIYNKLIKSGIEKEKILQFFER